jgi:type II secretion system protein I
MNAAKRGIDSALKGRSAKAQGEALGSACQELSKALTGRNAFADADSALSGLRFTVCSNTQGYALGCRILAFQARRTRRVTFTPAGLLKNGPVPYSGFTLLEIILALAILAGSLAALGEVMRLADQSATLTEGETQAQILASSVMDELVSGARELSVVSQAGLVSDADPPWLYSIAVENTGYEELISVRVSVEQQLEARLQPARFELVRWMPNPDFVPAETGEEAGSSTSSSTSGSSSSGSGSSSATGGSGVQP